MTVVVANVNGQTIKTDVSRISGGVYHSQPGDLILELANCACPNVVTVSLATTGNVQLPNNGVRYTTVRTTSDGTIASANINLPLNVNDGYVCTFVSTGIITQVLGTANGANCIPVVTTVAAGGKFERRYDALTKNWLAA